MAPFAASATLAATARAPRVAALCAAAALIASLASAEEEYRPLRTGGVSAEAAALLVSGQEGGSVPLWAVALAAIAEPGAPAPVELFVEAAGAPLLANHGSDRLRLELCLYALRGPSVAGATLETVELDLTRDRERLLAGGVKSRSLLELAAGEYQLRVLVRNAQTGVLGLRSYPLVVPAADAPAATQPLLVPDPPGGWLRLTRQPEAPAIGFWPAARPVLAPDGDAELHALVRGLQPDAARLEFAGAGGETLAVPVALTPAESGAPAGLDRWLVRARTPALEPGDYELQLRVADAPASRRLPVVVRSGGGTWVEVAAEPVADLAEAAAMPAVGRPARGSRRAAAELGREFEGRYREILGRLARADTAGAVSELVRLETEAFGREGGAVAVAEVQLRIARALARSNDAGLPPLFDLHYRAYRRYLESDRWQLSTQARGQLLLIVDLFLAQNPQDPSPATNVLAVLANQLQQSGLSSLSGTVFRNVLAIDPAHEGALVGLAAGLEKHGNYGEASEVLDALVTAHPEHRPARLRLAVNLLRLGRGERARELLAELVGEPHEDWVLAVAYHELARDLIRRERLDEAETVLAEGSERLPEDDQLRLLLAAVMDLRQDGPGVEGASLAMRSRADRPTARHQYQQWPELRPAAPAEERQREALAQALQGLGGAA